ncbi:MAG TPA: dihydrofolate reductase family protein [Polyangiaceae bacterium]|jgi:riboflavin biosynthesis pyrimidine reductase|nr:dihydrofolate reductase family protein [Polyangiaceae bacterium]
MSARTSDDIAPGGRPLELLFEHSDLPRFELPEALSDNYGGTLGFSSPCLIANFVASLDGVVAVPGSVESGQIISGRNPADRFVMGLLRACADAVLVGAGTFRKSSGHLWYPERIYPAAAALFAEARERLGLAPQPQFVLLSQSGELDTTEPAIEGALIVTTRAGESQLRARVPKSSRVVALGESTIELAKLIELLRAEGYARVLTEGGPTLFAELVAQKLLSELFLTSAPSLFGRYADDERKSLADGLDLGGAQLELLSARRHGSHLFLRYALE